MDPLHAWKDDFRREVEEVLAARSRCREAGKAPTEAGFGGRLSDMVIPPAGTYTELREAVKRLELAQGEAVELRGRLGAKESALEREKESRKRLKDGLVRLSLALREKRAACGTAEDSAKKARTAAEAAALALAAARVDAEHTAARAEDWEREAVARRLGVRDVQARLDRALLDSDAKDAQVASLTARLEAAEKALEASRRAETAAMAKARIAVAELREKGDQADIAVADARRAVAQAAARLEKERDAERLRAELADRDARSRIPVSSSSEDPPPRREAGPSELPSPALDDRPRLQKAADPLRAPIFQWDEEMRLLLRVAIGASIVAVLVGGAIFYQG